MKKFTSIKGMHLLVCSLLTPYPLYSQVTRDDTTSPDSLTKTRNLREVVVTGTAWKGKDRIGLVSVSGAEINKRPALLGEHDVIKALQSTSGVVSGTEGFAGLYVRGGETDQNLYLLDGLPLMNVYHFGGLFSTFSTHSVENVDFYKGGFPSIFAERASSIVDVALRQPNYNHTTGTFSVGLISGQLYLSTPLRKGSSALAVALRRTWFDVFSTPALAIINATKRQEGRKTIFHYGFTDMTVKLSATDRRKNDLSFLFFYGNDNFKLGEENFDPDDRKHVLNKDVNKMSWGNLGLTADYRLHTSAGNLRIQLYVSKAFASDTEENMNYDGDFGNTTASTEVRPSVLQVGMRETFSFPIMPRLDGEAGLQQVWYDYKVGNPSVSYSGITGGPVHPSFSEHSRNGILSGFGELHWNMAGSFQGSIGVRVSRYLSPRMKHWDTEPRLSMKVNLPHNSNISAGYSRMAQYAQQVSSNYMYLPSDAWLPTASIRKPLLCDIFSLGYFKGLKNGFNVKAELWWKNMQNLAEYKPNTSVATTTLPWYGKLTFGKGVAYGLDLEIDGHFKSVAWNVAYGLLWNWRKFPDINMGERYPAKFDNRHKLDINASWKINHRLELTAQWEYMTGNRTTLALYNIATPDLVFPDSPFVSPLEPGGDHQDGIDYFEKRNNVRLPAFHRLNLNLSMKGRINNRLTYQWDFGLYNAYCRMNPFSVVKKYENLTWSDKGDFRRFKTLSLLPILPSVSYTINF